jgi:hypothetical protein
LTLQPEVTALSWEVSAVNASQARPLNGFFEIR